MGGDTILNQILADFTTAGQGQYPQILLWGLRILESIILLQWCYAAVEMGWTWDIATMVRDSLNVLLRAVLLRTIIGDLWDLCYNGLQGIVTIAQQVSGQSPNTITPSGTFNLGLSIVGTLFSSRSWWAWLHPVDDGIFFLVAVITVVAFGIAAIIYLMAMIEAVYHVAMGPIVLCWTPFEMTWDSLAKWIERLLGLAIKIVGLILSLAIFIGIATIWNRDLIGLGGAGIADHHLGYTVRALIESIVFLLITWQVPRGVASIIHGSLGGAGWGQATASQAVDTAVNTAQTVAGAATTVATGRDFGRYVERKLLT